MSHASRLARSSRRALLVLVASLGLATSAWAGKEASVALGADYTFLRDDVNSVGYTYRGLIPTLRLAYEVTDERRIHGARLGLAMGNPSLPHDFNALLMHPSLGYRYVRGLPDVGRTDLYVGGGLLTQGIFLTSSLGRIGPTPAGLRARADPPLPAGRLEVRNVFNQSVRLDLGI